MATGEGVAVVIKTEDQVLTLAKRVFSTDPGGYYGSGEVLVDGKIYQVSLNVVEIINRGK